MQRFEKCHEGRGLCRTQVVSIGGHVAAALNHLPDELVLRQSNRDTVQSRASLSAGIAKGVAVAALLYLKHQRALTFQCGCAMYEPIRNGITAPRIHVRTPRCELRETGESPECDCNQQHRENRNGPPLPALFSFAGKERQKNQRQEWPTAGPMRRNGVSIDGGSSDSKA